MVTAERRLLLSIGYDMKGTVGRSIIFCKSFGGTALYMTIFVPFYKENSSFNLVLPSCLETCRPSILCLSYMFC